MASLLLSRKPSLTSSSLYATRIPFPPPPALAGTDGKYKTTYYEIAIKVVTFKHDRIANHVSGQSDGRVRVRYLSVEARNDIHSSLRRTHYGSSMFIGYNTDILGDDLAIYFITHS